MARKRIPDTIKLQLWVKSAGRCEFKGCNDPVWYNGLTLSTANFSEVCHIIGSSEDGPRGGKDSKELETDFSNLMLLCKRCHKEVDNHTEKYTVDLLREWKKEHENRIEMQTRHPEDIHKSHILLCTINIGDRVPPINIEAVRSAMFPKYPVDLKGIRIEETDFKSSSSEDQWQAFAESKIKRKLERAFELGIDETAVKHLSIFSIAPMPLLFYLGKCVGDTIPCDVYQSHRNIDDTSKTWSWKDSSETHEYFNSECIRKVDGSRAILKLAISDQLNEDKYHSLLDEQTSVYQITVSEPSTHFLNSKKQLEVFSFEYRKMLNLIQATHGRNCEILILPAVPVAIAIESGRAILPTKDPSIFVCQYYTDHGFKRVLQIN